MKLLYLLPFILFGCSAEEELPEPEQGARADYVITLMEVCPTNQTHWYHDVTKEEYDKVIAYLQTKNVYCVTVSFKSSTTGNTETGWYGGSYDPTD